MGGFSCCRPFSAAIVGVAVAIGGAIAIDGDLVAIQGVVFDSPLFPLRLEGVIIIRAPLTRRPMILERR